MEFYVDSADIDVVRAINDYFPIDGFTTNPNLLTQAEKPLNEMFAAYKKFVQEENLLIFVQVTAQDADGMLRQAKQLREYFGKYLVVKVPATREGYRACKLCKRLGIRVCVTVVHSIMQGIIAAKAGADFTAPYISHIDNLGADGVHCVKEMVRVFAQGGWGCKVLGASFRTVEQVDKLASVGCQAVTIAPATFDMLIAHPSTDVSMLGFNKAWQDKFGEKQVTDFLPIV